MIKEIFPNIYSWSEYSEEKQLDFNGYLVIGKEESVIIDPPALVNEDQAELKNIIGKHSSCPLNGILLTNVHHERTSDLLKNQLSIPVLVNELDNNGLDVRASKTFKGGGILLGGLQSIQLNNQKSPGETAFYMFEQKIMFVGDALIGKVPGQVNMLPLDKYQDPLKAKAGLKELLNYEFETLLVGDGVSIMKDAKEKVASFLAS
jgi:glyoxylase-like metal-dependent hydrolase (beta-lactamase superfamily II)